MSLLHMRLGVRWQRLAPLLISALVVLAYANSFAGAFVFDDQIRIHVNYAIRDLLEAVTMTTRPLVGLTLYLNYALGGLYAPDYHLVNLVIHIGAALSVYGIVRRTLLLQALRGRYGASSAGLSLAVAAIWAVHPLQTQSVTYVIQRAESLMGLFYLLTLYAFVRSLGSQRPDRWQTASIVFCALGMATKPVMVTAPLVVWLYDRTFTGRKTAAGDPRSRWPFYMGLAGTWVVLVSLLCAPNESSTSAGFSAGMFSPLRYFLSQQGVLVHYLKLAFWPRSLCLDYGWPPATSARDVLLPAMVTGPLLAGSIWGLVRARPLGFLGVWFFTILAPTSTFIPVADLAVEHRMYLPLAAIVTLVVVGFHETTERLPGPVGPIGRRGIRVAILAACAGALILLTIDRNRDYASVEGMAGDIVAKRPLNFRAQVALAARLTDKGEFAKAERSARDTLDRVITALREGGAKYQVSATSAAYYYPVVLDLLGRAVLCQGRSAEALPHFREALRVAPDSYTTRHNLALALFLSGDKETALREAQTVVDARADYGYGHELLALIASDKGDYRLAIHHYEAAITHAPDLIFAECELAWLLATCPEDALRDGSRALRLSARVVEATRGASSRALDVMGAALAETGDFDRAMAVARRALEICRQSGAGPLRWPGMPQGTVEEAGGTVETEKVIQDLQGRLRLYEESKPLRIH